MSRFIRPGLLRVAAAGIALACAGCVYVPGPYYTEYPSPAPAATSSAPLASADRKALPSNCREFQQTVTIDGDDRQAFGTTCQQPDGTWRVMPPR